jgi:hypothetical protein
LKEKSKNAPALNGSQHFVDISAPGGLLNTLQATRHPLAIAPAIRLRIMLRAAKNDANIRIFVPNLGEN